LAQQSNHHQHRAGDLLQPIHHRCELEHLDWAPTHADAPQIAVTRRQACSEFATSNALAIAPHEASPSIGRITADGDHFRWNRFDADVRHSGFR
jgi:hypothetical protein